MKLSFKGKSAVVTGACGGMGIECVKLLHKAGLKVLMLDIKKPPINFLTKYKRAKFKKEINQLTNSKIIEVKSYEKY